ncbi:MAG: hypothetical protein A2X25_00945 [Chloroflexi bacterium GWB2_49_20]|nr:MAG: hypothetical protein A2X25_00945 [Chloroflexi bacterium GWB2_49_20]OGN77522.1 MAG: hypothetical protein A2X26_02155 [Chloroflexi bacterium GWC2_49_37]OGN83215.1 MAG: hypothetical protein A2X27_13565 [Chloroflexi bacterium GWD2_49_16]
MDYKLEELIDISLFQKFQDRLNEIYPFPSAIIDNDGKILTATAWNPICTQFHRINPQSKKECIISDQYILEHIDEANPAVSYRCPHGMVDNAIPIIIAGKHLANFFTGQFFLQPPDLDFFKQQAAKYGFDEASYLDAVRNTPVWSEAQLNKYLGFIQHFVNSLAEMGLTRLEDIENKNIIEASEARYRDLFETAPVLYVIAHELQGVPVILDCNQVFLDALGYKRTEVLGKELMEFYAPDSRAEFLEKGGYQMVISGNLVTKDCWLVCKNGKKLGCMVWARPEMGPGGQVVGIRAAYMDITNRKETEQALQASELRYTTTLDALSDAVHVVDQDLTIQLNNVTASKWVQELGYSGIVAGKNLFKAFPFLSESVRDEYQQVFHTGKMLVAEETAHVGGSDMYTETRKIPIFENGIVEKIVTVVRDISDRKQAEQALRSREEQLASIYETVGDVIFLLEVEGKAQYRFVSVNSAFCRVTGLPREAVIGKRVDEVIPEPSLKMVLGKYRRAIKTKSIVRWEEISDYPSGQLTGDASISPVFNAQGHCTHLVGSVHDITERKRAEEALKNERNFALLVMNSMGQGLTVTDEQGCFEYVNPAYAKMVGYDPKDLLGKAPWEFTALEDQDILTEAGIKRHRGQTTTYETHLNHIDGHKVPVTITGVPRHYAGEVRGTIAVITDLSERKQAEEEKNKLLHILEASLNEIYVFDPATLIFSYANEASLHNTGYTFEEFKELTPLDIKHEFTENAYREMVAPLLAAEKEILVFQTNHYRKDGSFYPVEVNLQVVQTKTERIFLAVIYDITERKRAEETLRVSEEKFRNLFNNTEVGMFRTRLDGSEILDVNDRYLKILGRTREEMLGSVSELYWADPLERKEMVRRLEAEGHVVDFECGMLNKQGEVRRCLASSRLYREVGILEGSILDITERKRAEDVVRESEEKYRTLVELSPDVVLIHVDGIIQFANAASVKLFEADGKDDLIGKKMIELLHPDYQKIVRQRISQLTDENAEVPMLEEKYVTLKGNTFNAEVSAVPITISGKKGVQVVARDISERKKAEAEVRRRVEELDSLQKTVLDITAAQNLPGLLESIVERACQMLGAPGGGMYLSDPGEQEVHCVVSYHTPNNYVGVVLKYGDGLAGKVAQTGQPINIPDYQSWSGRALQFEQDKPFSAVLGVPLLWGGQVKGVLDLLHFEIGKSFSKSDVELVNLFAGHAAIAIENARLLEASLAGEAEVRTLSTRLAEAEENERRRIARELHDQVGQSLSALSINLNIMLTQIPEYLPGFKRRLEDSLMLIDQTTDHIRSLMSELRPSVLDDYGLKAALDWAAGSVASRTNLKLLVEGECNRFSSRVEIALFRIAQEALVNISRHARARTVKILLTQTGPDFSMSIKDDGVGFDPTATPANGKSGWGLRLMRERAESIGGSLQVESAPGQGTTITVKTHDQNSPGR